jgi:pimeloyl-ACP methyl ester carboxylesterase
MLDSHVSVLSLSGMPFVTAAGHALEYEWIEGKPGHPVLVFLHEGLGSLRQWRDFPERIARATGCAALVYSRYGYGQSDVLAEARRSVRFMHEEALDSLPQVLQELRIEAPVLVGHSDGASIALIHAGAGHPVRGVAVMAPHVFVEDVCLRSIEAARLQFETTDLSRRLGKYHRDPRKSFYLWNDVWLDPEFRRWNIEEYLPRIRCPVIAIQGEDDAYGTMAQLDAISAQVSGPCELVKLEHCGHSPFRDQPDAAAAALVRFVASIPSAQTEICRNC